MYLYFLFKKETFAVGDLIWAKIKGHPYWPATVVCPMVVCDLQGFLLGEIESWSFSKLPFQIKAAAKGNTWSVHFFGTCETSVFLSLSFDAMGRLVSNTDNSNNFPSPPIFNRAVMHWKHFKTYKSASDFPLKKLKFYQEALEEIEKRCVLCFSLEVEACER